MYYFLFFFSSCLHACDYWRENLGTKMGRLALLPSPLASPFNFTRNFFMYPHACFYLDHLCEQKKRKPSSCTRPDLSIFFFFLLLSSMLGGSGGGVVVVVVVDVLVKMEKCQIYWERKKKSLKKSKEHISDQHSSSLN